MQYPLKFIQKDNSKDGSDHLFTLVYKFFCTESKLHYILRAEYHAENVFGIKFYCQKDSKSDHKYNKIINRNGYSAVINIFETCLSLIPELLEKYPDCSFGLLSSRTIDFSNPKKLTEDLVRNQRYRVYTAFIRQRIRGKTFTHFQYPKISAYLLVNNSENADLKELRIKEMFERTYATIPDLDI